LLILDCLYGLRIDVGELGVKNVGLDIGKQQNYGTYALNSFNLLIQCIQGTRNGLPQLGESGGLGRFPNA